MAAGKPVFGTQLPTRLVKRKPKTTQEALQNFMEEPKTVGKAFSSSKTGEHTVKGKSLGFADKEVCDTIMAKGIIAGFWLSMVKGLPCWGMKGGKLVDLGEAGWQNAIIKACRRSYHLKRFKENSVKGVYNGVTAYVLIRGEPMAKLNKLVKYVMQGNRMLSVLVGEEEGDEYAESSESEKRLKEITDVYSDELNGKCKESKIVEERNGYVLIHSPYALPNSKLQCILSCGCGLFKTEGGNQ